MFSCFKKKQSWEPNLGEDEIKRFYVVTTIFNPAKFKSRYDLYHQFCKHMETTNAQLITVECIFPSLGQNQFQVTQAKNPRHIQLTSNSVYWVKENLINIAVSRLPTNAEWICWLDADIYFEDKNWIAMTIEELKQNTVVQVFEKCNFLGPLPEAKILRVDHSFGFSVVHGKPIDQNRHDEWYPHPGYGWAMSISTFREMGGLPEYDILGSADLHFAYSLVNKLPTALETNLNPQFLQFILAISERTFNTLSALSKSGTGVKVGYVPVTICHNWHGSRSDRQYVNRWKILIAHSFHLLTHMRRRDNGLLEFNAGNDALQMDILDYFQLRKEDDLRVDDDDRKVKSGRKDMKKKSRRKSSKKDDDDDTTFVDLDDDDPVFDIPEADDDSGASDGGDGCRIPEDGANCGCPEGPRRSICPEDIDIAYEPSHQSHKEEFVTASNYMNDYGGIIGTTSYY